MPTSPLPQLWSDERINDLACKAAVTMRTSPHSLVRDLEDCLKVIRDEYEADNARLRAGLDDARAMPDDVRDIFELLLNDEYAAIIEHHYDVYGADSKSEKLGRVNAALAWLSSQEATRDADTKHD